MAHRSRLPDRSKREGVHKVQTNEICSSRRDNSQETQLSESRGNCGIGTDVAERCLLTASNMPILSNICTEKSNDAVPGKKRFHRQLSDQGSDLSQTHITAVGVQQMIFFSTTYQKIRLRQT